MNKASQARCCLVSVLVFIGSVAPFGCSDQQANAGLSPSVGCNVSADCPVDNECSANGCVPYAACADSSSCIAGQNCVAGVCRATCASDAQCAPLKLSCDLAAGVCEPSPSTPAGGSGGGSGSGAYQGGASATAGNGPGGSGGAMGGAVSTGGVSGSGALSVEITELIDDIEDGDASIIPTAERVGKWYFYNPSGDNVAGAINQSFSTTFSGANGTKYAVESKGGPLSGDPTQSYAGLAFDFDNMADAPTDPSRKAYDVSAWQGISFWAKGNTESTQSVRVEFPTLEVVKPEQQGTCMDGSGCYDSYGKEILLTQDWAEYRVAFSDLVQEGWGSAKSLDLHAVFGVAFEYLNTSSSFDFAIDQVAFYRESTTGGTSGGGGATGSAGGGTGGSGNGGGSATQCTGTLGGYADGSISFYTLVMGSNGVNCSFDILARNPDKIAHTSTGGGLDFGAINTADYAAAATCGACVEVDRDDGRKVVVTIVDQCPVSSNPKCTAGHIDLSPHAFDQVASESEGYVGTTNGGTGGKISWRYVACPTNETVQLRVKEPGNTSWNAVLVEASKYPIKSVSIGGRNASRQDYNYWLPPGGVMGDGSVVITDVNGGIITGHANVATQGDQDTGKQFSCQ